MVIYSSNARLRKISFNYKGVNMKQLVTIDFDVIMAPSIEWYNRMAPELDWDTLARDRDPFIQNFNADLTHYSRLTQWLLYQAHRLPKEKIVFIQGHDRLINYVDMNEKYEIINIDHHHDLGYDRPGYVENYETVGCANWGGILYKKQIVDNFTWLHNTNSDIKSIKPQYSAAKRELLAEYDLSQLKPDIIIVCFSPEWIPPNYRSLFYLWMDMLNIIYNTHYDFD